MDSADLELVQGDGQLRDGLIAGRGFHDQLRDEWVVIRGNGESGVSVSFHPHSAARRGDPFGDLAGARGEVLVGVLGGDAGLDAVAF